MNNETLKLLGAYILKEKNHRENASLLEKCLLDWMHDPIIYGALTAQINTEITQANALQDTIFRLTKNAAQGEQK